MARGEIDRLMVFMPPGHAKALALDTPIPTPSGWTTMGELRIGDSVFDETGATCRVVIVSDIFRQRPVYKVRTDSGDEITADADHVWRVSLCRKPRLPLLANGKGALPRPDRDDPASRFKLKTTLELTRHRSKRPMIEAAGALLLPEADLPLDPWVLGAWLGDGSSAVAAISAGADDQPWIRQELEAAGHPTKTWATEITFGVSDLRGRLVRAGVLNNKHIPMLYLRSSVAQRTALLQGLIDTDGTVSPSGQVVFCNTNFRLAGGVLELVRSLGVKASMRVGRATLNGRDCGEVYRVSFYHLNAARMPRKRQRCRAAKRTPNTYIDVTFSGIADTVCVAVDSPSHLFLCGRSMTPTHNTEYASVLFPPWFLSMRPGFDVIAASYGQDFADRNSRKVIRLFQQYGSFLGTTLISEAVSEWATNKRGTYRAAGAGGGITGRRADLVIIDDPFRGRGDADSPTIRDKVWDWYRAEVITRLKPDARIVLIMTRWHEDDLAGRLLVAESVGADKWEMLNLPALAEDNDQLGRAPGEALWPEWEGVAALERKRASVGEREWAALFQQRPRPIEGALFKSFLVDVLDAAPVVVNTVRAWDLAATKQVGSNDPDWTVGVKLGRTDEGRYIVLDVVRLRGGPDDVEAAIVNTAGLDGRRVPIRLAEDPGQAGKTQTLYLTRKLAGYTVTVQRETGDKATRAAPVASQVNVGNLGMVKAPWNMAFREELAAFPSGTHDDQVDALAGAFEVVGLKPPPIRISAEAFARLDRFHRR